MKPIICILALSFRLLASEQSGIVFRVVDGDTIHVSTITGVVPVRLYGIDCPEAGQPFSREAKELATQLTLGKSVTFIAKETDHYGRTVAEVLLHDGRSANRELVKAGLAWWFRRYAASDWLLQKLEATARDARRGLWADSQSIPPWEWRQRSRPAKAGGQ